MSSVNITASPRLFELVILKRHNGTEETLEKWGDEVDCVLNEAQAAALISEIAQQLHDLAAEREE